MMIWLSLALGFVAGAILLKLSYTREKPMKQLQLTAVHGKGFDHEIVDMATGAHVAKVFAWESDSFELAQLLSAAPAMLNVLKDIAGVYAGFNGLEPNYPGWVDDVKDVIAQTEGRKL